MCDSPSARGLPSFSFVYLQNTVPSESNWMLFSSPYHARAAVTVDLDVDVPVGCENEYSQLPMADASYLGFQPTTNKNHLRKMHL